MSETLQRTNRGLPLFIAEAKRRHVFKAAGLYAGAAFVILQLADILTPTFGIPEAVIFYLLILIAIGFPMTSPPAAIASRASPISFAISGSPSFPT